MKTFPRVPRVPMPIAISTAIATGAVIFWASQPAITDSPYAAPPAHSSLPAVAALPSAMAATHPSEPDSNKEAPQSCCGDTQEAFPSPAPAATQYPTGNDGAVVQKFDDWAARYAQASEADRDSMIPDGITYARERRVVMERLIENDPRTAIELADHMSPYSRRALPPQVAGDVERPVSGRGDLQVLGVLSKNGQPYRRVTKIDGEVYETYTYGKRLAPIPETDTPLIGYSLPVKRQIMTSTGQTVSRNENVLALRENKYRVLSRPEIAMAREEAPAGEAQPHCAVSGAPTNSNGDESAVDVGGKVVWLCKNGHIDAYLRSQDGSLQKVNASGPARVAALGNPGEGAGAFPATSAGWNTGNKQLIALVVRFPEQAANPFGSTNIASAVSSAAMRMNQWSYGRATFSANTTGILTLPKSEAQYASNGGEDAMMTDAISVANSQGYNASAANFKCLIFSGSYGGYCGLGQITGGWSWIKCIDARTITHEVGHNLGLPHANAWVPLTSNPVGPGSHSEYGGAYSVMGSDDAPYDTMERFYIRWLTLNETWDVSTAGTYRIYDPEVTSLTNGLKHTIRISTADGNYYFVEFRPRATALAGNAAVNTNTQNGIRILRTDGAQQLDVTPGSANGTQDGALTVGGSFTDPATGVTITSLAKGGSGTAQYMDVQVSFGSATLYSGGVYELAPQCAPNKRLDVSGGADANNANVQIWSSNDGNAQRWKLESQAGGLWELIPQCANGRRLDVLNAGTTNGTNVQIYQDNNGTAQRWTLTSVGGGYYELIPQCAPAQRLDVSGAGNGDGVNVQLWGANSGPAQRWRLVPVRPHNGEVYEMEPQSAPGKRLDVANSVDADGSNVLIWSATGAPNQAWKFEDRGDGLWEVTPGSSSIRRLDISNGGTTNGTNVQIWTDNNSVPQRWWAINVGGGYFELIPQVSTSMRLDVNGGGNADNTNVHIWTTNSSSAQRWRLFRK